MMMEPANRWIWNQVHSICCTDHMIKQQPNSLEHDQGAVEVAASDNEPVFLHNSP
jgi:hypothetical protein